MKKTNNKNKLITTFNNSLLLNKFFKEKNNKLRNIKTSVKTAKNRKLSSTLWLHRQLNDIYIKKAKIDGYISRAAYKLLEINEKFNIIKPNFNIIDLGASPGGWTQVVSNIIGEKGIVVAVDLLDLKIKPANCSVIQGNFLKESTIKEIQSICPNKVDVVLSDMAPNTSGNKDLDHLRILNILEATLSFANKTLLSNGSLVTKIFQGGLEKELYEKIKINFKEVKYFKPKSSRKESKELYLIAKGFMINNSNLSH